MVGLVNADLIVGMRQAEVMGWASATGVDRASSDVKISGDHGVKRTGVQIGAEHREGIQHTPGLVAMAAKERANARKSVFGKMLDGILKFFDYKYEHKASHVEVGAQLAEAVALGGFAAEMIKNAEKISEFGLPPPPPPGVELEIPSAAELATPGLEMGTSLLGFTLSLGSAFAKAREWMRMGKEKDRLKAEIELKVSVADTELADPDAVARLQEEVTLINSERRRIVATTTADVFASGAKATSKTIAYAVKAGTAAAPAVQIAGQAVGVAGSAVSTGLAIYGAYDGYKGAAAAKAASRELDAEIQGFHEDVKGQPRVIEHQLVDKMFYLRKRNLDKQLVDNTVKKWTNGIQAAVGSVGLTASSLGLAIAAGAAIGAAGAIAAASLGAGAGGIAVLLLGAAVTYAVVKNWDAIKLWGRQQSNRIQRGWTRMKMAFTREDTATGAIAAHAAETASTSSETPADMSTHSVTAGAAGGRMAQLQARLTALQAEADNIKVQRRQLRNAKKLGVDVSVLQDITRDLPLPVRYGGTQPDDPTGQSDAEKVAETLISFLEAHRIPAADEDIEAHPDKLIGLAMTYLTEKVRR